MDLMEITEIKQSLALGDLVLFDGKLFTREEWAQIKEAEHLAEHFDLLQLTKKIQL